VPSLRSPQTERGNGGGDGSEGRQFRDGVCGGSSRDQTPLPHHEETNSRVTLKSDALPAFPSELPIQTFCGTEHSCSVGIAREWTPPEFRAHRRGFLTPGSREAFQGSRGFIMKGRFFGFISNRVYFRSSLIPAPLSTAREKKSNRDAVIAD